MPELPIPVSTGFTWTSFFTGGSFLALVALVIRQVGPWRKQTTDAQDTFIATLGDTIKKQGERIDKLETLLAHERRTAYIETRRLEARHAAYRSLDRHKFTNSESSFDSLLRILELSPEKAPEAARQARETRARQRETEALEAAAIHRAEMEAVTQAEKELDDDKD